MPSKNGITAAAFGSYVSHGSLFLSSIDQVEREETLLPYAHYLRQVWKDLDLAGVLCVDDRPTVYLCEGARFSPDEKRAKQQIVWNQGLVPLLIFLTPNNVEVHSTVKKPTQSADDAAAELPSLISDLGNIAEALECQKLVRSIETGQFFQTEAKFFPTNESVDRCLIENLVYTARKLKDAGWKQERAYSLLGRALFVSFLEAREFIKPDYYPAGTKCLTDILAQPTVAEAKQQLYREFFQKLKHEFNGTMFDAALTAEERDIKKVHLDILADFLNAADMKTGDLTLDFWAYDFRYIPVETISAIYEEFLKETDLDKKRRDGAFYTPRHLAETTLHIALENRYDKTADWKALDPAMGSGIFLVAMFNLLAEQWLRKNPDTRRQTKAQALLKILQTQICGVDKNPVACRIAAFSLYLALFEKLQPTDVDEFKKYVRADHFLPPLLWEKDGDQPELPVVLSGNFLEDKLPLKKDFDLIIGNPPWESRGDKQIALRFVKSSRDYLCDGGVACLLLPSTILVNLHGSLDGDWFRSVTVEKMVQLADFRFVLFEATHPCFILRYCKQTPTLEHTVAYETPKLNRFDRRTGVIVVEPDDQKLVPQRDVSEMALVNKLQIGWSRKFWGTQRDEAFLRRLDFLPSLSKLVGVRGKQKRWLGGTGFQPYRENRKRDNYNPVPLPWPLTEPFLDANSKGLGLVVFEDQLITVGEKLKQLGASTKRVLFARMEANFTPPMVLYSQGFTKIAFCAKKVRFQNALRSITGPQDDANLLRFLSVVMGSRLVQYQAFHSGSSNGIGREQFNLYESLNLPFPLPNDELAVDNSTEIVLEASEILKEVERTGKKVDKERRAELVQAATAKLEPLVEAYYRVTDAERILIADTLTLWQPSIHSHNLDKTIPSLAFPTLADRKRYADTLCDVLNRRARKQGIRIRAESMASKALNLIFFTVIFGSEAGPHKDAGGNDDLWKALKRVDEAAQRENGPFNYLRGFSYFKHDRLYMLKPATMRNWSRASALNDADAIFEHLNTGNT